MTPSKSERFLADLKVAFERAAEGNTARALEALDWLRNRAAREGGFKAGWGAEQVWMMQDESPSAEKHRMACHLRRTTWLTIDQIAERVHLSGDRVAHILSEANIRKAENLED